MAWNEERVKLHLPNVRIIIGGKILNGRLEGRCLPRPVIWVYTYMNPGLDRGFRRESTWQEVVTSLNQDKPLGEGKQTTVTKKKRPIKKTRARS